MTGRAVYRRRALQQVLQRHRDVVLALLLVLDALHGDALLHRLRALAVVAAFLDRRRGHGGGLVLLWVGRHGVGLLGVGVVLGIGLRWGR